MSGQRIANRSISGAREYSRRLGVSSTSQFQAALDCLEGVPRMDRLNERSQSPVPLIGATSGAGKTTTAAAVGRPMTVTREPELNAVLAELLSGVRSVLARRLVGLYLHGSLALGDFDRHSDVDFVVAVDGAVDEDQLAALQHMHGRIYALESRWAQHLEGSYLTAGALCRLSAASPAHLYLDHGSRELVRSRHDNNLLHRHVLREHGIALAGPGPVTLMDPVPPDELRAEVLALLEPWMGTFLADPAPLGNGWRQPYTVLTLCRMLYTLHHAAVASKRVAAEWAMNALDDRWAGLIQRAWSQRPDPALKARAQSAPRDVRATVEFIRHAHALAASGGPGPLPLPLPQRHSDRRLPLYDVGVPSS